MNGLSKLTSFRKQIQFQYDRPSIAARLDVMHWINNGLLKYAIVAGVLCLSLNANAALNRKDVVEVIKGINVDYDSGLASVSINELAGEPDPGVLVGDELTYAITSSDARYFLLVLVDPKGTVSVVFPDYAVRASPGKYQRFIYPPAGSGSLTQEEPVGIETVFAFASATPLTLDDYEFPKDSDIHTLDKRMESIDSFVSTTNTLLADSSVLGAVYQYFVDSDVQYSTRAVRRELKKRMQQVDVLAEESSDKPSDTSGVSRAPGESSGDFKNDVQSDALAVNDIRFNLNSAVLTSVGKTQLDVFGGELLSILEDSPGIDVLLEGHTDDTGTSDYNQDLSERRAASARQYLVQEFDLPQKRLRTRGMGEHRPLTEDVDSTSRALNRRVEIRLGRVVN